MNEWVSTKDKLPEPGQIVITWNGRDHTISRYEKALTWKGYKLKFVNIMSGYGAWNDDITHWMRFPKPPCEETPITKTCQHLEKYRFIDRDGNLRCSDCHKVIEELVNKGDGDIKMYNQEVPGLDY